MNKLSPEDEARVKAIETRIMEIKKTLRINADAIDKQRREGKTQSRELVELGRRLADEQRDLIVESNRIRGITLSVPRW